MIYITKNFTLTADGIALGAAAASSHTDIEMIVFFAIMLHKAPAAFGLVTFLLHEGLERNRIRRHLLTFAFAAPIGAFITYILITQVSFSRYFLPFISNYISIVYFGNL